MPSKTRHAENGFPVLSCHRIFNGSEMQTRRNTPIPPLRQGNACLDSRVQGAVCEPRIGFEATGVRAHGWLGGVSLATFPWVFALISNSYPPKRQLCPLLSFPDFNLSQHEFGQPQVETVVSVLLFSKSILLAITAVPRTKPSYIIGVTMWTRCTIFASVTTKGKGRKAECLAARPAHLHPVC